MSCPNEEWNLGVVGASSASNCSCPAAGRGYNTLVWGCDRCRWSVWCEAKTSASKAPLCSLPEYMVSRYKDVRRTARARFDELQAVG